MTISLQIWVDCSSGQNVVQTLVQNPSRSSLALPVQSIRFLLVSPKINKAKSARSFSVGVLCGVVAYRLTYGSTCGIAVAPMVLYASQTQRILYVVRRSSIVRMMLIEVRVSNWKSTERVASRAIGFSASGREREQIHELVRKDRTKSSEWLNRVLHSHCSLISYPLSFSAPWRISVSLAPPSSNKRRFPSHSKTTTSSPAPAQGAARPLHTAYRSCRRSSTPRPLQL